MKQFPVFSKVIALVMVLAMALSLLPVVSLAAESYPTEGAYVFSFSDNGIAVIQEGEGGKYKASGTELKIQAAGTYIVSGSCAEGFIQVSKGVTDVTLVLNGLTLTNATTCPLSLNKSTGVTLVVAPGTVNTLTDNAYNNDTVYADNADAENAVIKCKDGSQVTICGTGTLNLNAKGERGLKSGGQDIETNPDVPRDAWLVIKEATINITSTAGNGANGGDAIKADQLLKVLSGNLNLSYTGDGIQSEAELYVGEVGKAGPTITMTNGYEGLEGDKVYCYSGDITITVKKNTAEDSGGNCIQGKTYLQMVGGTYTLSTDDDAIKSDYDVYIGAPCSTEGPTINVLRSYEGIEGACIYIYGGNINVEASDDAMNAANSDLGSSQPPAPGSGGRPGAPGSGSSSSYAFDLQILGGKIYCNSGGDGLDSNKALTIRGGESVVLSSTQQDNSALDVDGVTTLTGGVFLGVSYKGMFKSISNSQYYLTASNQSISAGQKIWVTDINGNTFNASTTTATRRANFIIFSSPELANSPSENYIHYGNTSYNSGRQGAGVSNPYTVTAHKMVISPAVPATCTTPGLTEGSYCSGCGMVVSVQQEVPMLEHIPVDVPAVAPTCTEKGNEAGTKCSLCNTVLSGCEKIKKLGHDIQVQNKVDVTCTTDGFSGDEYCLRCNTVVTAGEVITAPGHTVVTTPPEAPTCDAPGKTEGSHCSTCGEIFVAQEEIPALGHSVVVMEGTPATCTTPGKTEGKYCSVCNQVLVEQTVIPALGHTAVTVEGTPATCLSSGLTDGQKCSVCGIVLVQQQTIPRLGHEYKYADNGDGTHTGSCIRCSKTTKAEPHTMADGACTACGYGVSTPEVDANIKINHTLNLASDISINYAVLTSALTQYDSFYMECTIPVYEGNVQTGTKTVTLEPQLTGSFYYFTLTGITAVQMGDTVESVLHMTKDGKEFISATDVYSVATYAYSQMKKTSVADSLKTLCADLLRYGAAAQTFKNYRTDSLADKDMTLEQALYLSDITNLEFGDNYKVLNDLANPTVTWAGKALSLESKVVLKFVFNASAYTGSVDSLKLKISYMNYAGQTVTTEVGDAQIYNANLGLYAFDFDGLLAAELRSVLTVAVYAGDTQVSPSMCYSADSYGNGRTGTLLDLCKALVAYSDSALIYFK